MEEAAKKTARRGDFWILHTVPSPPVLSFLLAMPTTTLALGDTPFRVKKRATVRLQQWYQESLKPVLRREQEIKNGHARKITEAVRRVGEIKREAAKRIQTRFIEFAQRQRVVRSIVVDSSVAELCRSAAKQLRRRVAVARRGTTQQGESAAIKTDAAACAAPAASPVSSAGGGVGSTPPLQNAVEAAAAKIKALDLKVGDKAAPSTLTNAQAAVAAERAIVAAAG